MSYLIVVNQDITSSDPQKHVAPEGQEWMCGACGKHGKNRMCIGDESCFLNAVLVWTESIVQQTRCRPTAAKAVSDGPLHNHVTLE